MENMIISYHIETQTDPELFDACEPIFCRSPRSFGDESFTENNNDKATQTDDLEGAFENSYEKHTTRGHTQNCFKKDHKVKNEQKKLSFENIQLDDLYKKDKTETLKDVGAFMAKTALISGGVIGGVSLALPLVGFTSVGVAAGSLAAVYQSTLGGTVAAGSAFAVCQSIGAAGMAASTQAAIVAGSGALVSAHSAVCNFIRKKIK